MAVSEQSKEKIAEFVADKDGLNVLYTNEPESDVFLFSDMLDGRDLANLIKSLGNSSTIRSWGSIPEKYQEKYPQMYEQVILHVW